MNFAPSRPRRRSGENIVPMINVVFLLLIFFLISAQFTAQDPFDVTPPDSLSDANQPGSDTLFVAADGTLGFEGETNDAALARLAGRDSDKPLFVRADTALPARNLAALLPRLARLGVQETRLVTGGR
ncbi:MAG: ExbD/TolR family protein [Roseobacter sp.]